MKDELLCDVCHSELKKNKLLFLFPPQKRQLRVKWNRALKKTLKDDSRVCQNHFHPSDISIVKDEGSDDKSKLRVRNTAIPFLEQPPNACSINPKRRCTAKTNTGNKAANVKAPILQKNDVNQSLSKNPTGLINERLYDAKEDYTESLLHTLTRNNLKIERTIKSDCGNGRICGLIKVLPTEMLYVISCFHCEMQFPLEDAVAFTQHMQDHHIVHESGVQESDTVYEKCDDNATDDASEACVTGDSDDNGENRFDSSTVGIESHPPTKSKSRNGVCSKGSNRRSNSAMANTEISPMNTINMDVVDSRTYLEFIDQLANHPLLWYPPQNNREYMEAMVALTQELNELWETDLKKQDVDASLRQLKEFYYKNLIFNQELQDTHQQYFDKCNQFMPDLDLCRFQKPVMHKEKTHNSVSPADNSSEEERQIIADEQELQQQQNLPSTATKDKYECEVCRRKYINVTKYKAHLASHTYRDNFLCHICAATFYSKLVYRTHLKRHRGALQCVCKICDLVFRESPRLTDHRKKCHFVLEGTVEELDERRQIAMERRANRSMLEQTLCVDPLTKAKYFRCNTCDETFRKYAQLYAHKITRHGYKTKKMLREADSNLTCEVCDKKLGNLISYNTHKKRHFGLTHCQCKICGLYFRESPRLTAHRKKCHFVLEGTIEELTELENILLNLPPQACKPTTNQNTGLKYYSCSGCGKSFEQQSILLLHKIREHCLRATAKNTKCKNAFDTVEDLMTNFNCSSYSVEDLVEEEEATGEGDESEIVEVFHPAEIEVDAHQQDDEQHQFINDIEIADSFQDDADNYEEIVAIERAMLDDSVDASDQNVSVITNNYNDDLVVYSEDYYYDQ